MPRKRVFDLNPELLDNVIQMYNNGTRITVIGKSIGVSYNTIKRALIERGIYKEVPEAIQERNRNIVHDHLYHGLSFTQLSRKYKLCFNMIDHIVHEHLSDRKTLASERICIENLLEQEWSTDMIINNTVFPKDDVLHILNILTRKQVDQLTKDAIIDDYIKGEKIQTIMREYRISQVALYNIIDEGGVERRRKNVIKI